MTTNSMTDVARPSRLHYAWVVLATTTVVLLASGGVRAAIGVFVKPLEAEFGWSRTTLSFAVAMSIALYGLTGPLVGRLADRWGPRWVLTAGAALVGIGTLAGAGVTQFWQFFVAVGLDRGHRRERHRGAGGRHRRHALVREAPRPRARNQRRGHGGRPARGAAAGDGARGVVRLARRVLRARRGADRARRAAHRGADPERPERARCPRLRRHRADPRDDGGARGRRAHAGQRGGPHVALHPAVRQLLGLRLFHVRRHPRPLHPARDGSRLRAVIRRRRPSASWAR